VLVDHVSNILSSFYDQLDASLPTVVTAHMTLDRALAGIEQELLVGYTMTFPSDIFVHPKVDYVALGHVHKHQVLQKSDPAIVYAGSLERVDFGEESEDKGFLHVKLERNNTSYQFHSIAPRPFITIDLDLANEVDPTKTICDKLDKTVVAGCILRVRYRVSQDQLAKLDENKIRAACQNALTVRLQPEIIPNTNRVRLPQLNESTIASPMVALETYLEEFAPERKDALVSRAREVMNEIAAQLENN
jgi:exonuclease SbcD